MADYGWMDVAFPHIGAHKLGGDAWAYLSGGSNPVTDIWNEVRGNPQDIKAAYDQAMARAQQGGQQTKDFLLGQQAKAQQFYAPMQKMFQGMYGTGGIQAPQVPGVPGSQPLQPSPQMAAMFNAPGGRR